MGARELVRKWLGIPFSPQPSAVSHSQRDFAAAAYSRITASLASDTDHIMRALRNQGRTLRARSRQLYKNNPYAAKFAGMCVSNICGPRPFELQAKIKSSRNRLDTFANSRVETEWTEWGRPGNCDLQGRLSWADTQRLIVRTLAADGECLVRIYEGSDFGPWGIQLQVIDTDRLDEDKNDSFPDGRSIVAGVELDSTGRTIAYHLLKSPPKQWAVGRISRDYIRVPAEQIIHLFLPTDAEQVRGVPWLHAALIQLHNLSAFDEAAIIAARVGASKMGFYTSPDGTLGMLADGQESNPDGSKGPQVQDAEPGVFDILPPGYDFKAFDPAYPDAMVADFKKAMLRGIASGLQVNYCALGNDAESVNFSSLRGFTLEERDTWMMLQSWLVEHLHQPVYRRWLVMADLTGRLRQPGQLAKYYEVTFKPKRWQWVDPLKDVQANIEAIKWGLKSRTQIVAETGADFEDILDQLALEHETAEEKDLDISGGTAGEPTIAAEKPDKEQPDDQD